MNLVEPGRRWPAVVLAAVVLGLIAGVMPAHAARAQDDAGSEPGQGDEVTSTTKPEYRGTDSRRDLGRPLVDPPFDAVRYPRDVPDGVRGIRLTPGSLELVENGRLAATRSLSGSEVTLPQIARVVDNDRWIAEVERGVYEVRAALVQAPGTRLAIRAPEVTEVRLVDLPGVFLGGDSAEAVIEGVTVTSWARDGSGPDTDYEDSRPFILYEDGARLDILDAEIAQLGSDRASAYGVSWRLDGTTGEVSGSEFHDNFFGVYTYEADGIVVRGNTFHHHVFYGVDPHDFSTNLLIEDNVAYANGSHGIIVSRGVTDSVIRHNRSVGNHGNGIVLDDASNRNHIVANLAEHNEGDGIVLLGSGESTVARNVVRGNRVGIRVNNDGAVDNVIRDNVVEGNRVGIEAYRGAADLRVTGNVIRGSRDTALRIAAPRTILQGGRIVGADTGIDIRSLVKVDGVTVSSVERGLRVAPGGVATATRLRVDADEVGVSVEEPSDVTLRHSRLSAPTALRGELTVSEANVMSAAPFVRSWLPIAGVGVLVIAVFFEAIRSIRSRHQGPARAPKPVWNTA